MTSSFKPAPFKPIAISVPKAVMPKALPAPSAVHGSQHLVSEAKIHTPPVPKMAFPAALKMAGVSGGQRPRQERIENLQKGQLA